MELIKCPRCGEMYSSSYRRCPFCEEEDRPRKKAVNKRVSHHVSEKKQTHSARGPMIVVLVVVLALLSWYLFGGKVLEKLNETRQNEVEDGTGDPIDPSYDPSISDEPGIIDPNEPTPPTVDDPNGTDEPGGTDDPSTSDNTTQPTVDVSSLTLKTNVGSLQKDANGTYDCTVKMSESIRLVLQGTDAQVTWSSADPSILTVDADGLLKPVKVGMTTVTASVGGASVECIIRVK